MIVHPTLDLSVILPGDEIWADKPQKNGIPFFVRGEVVEILDRSHYIIHCSGADVQILGRNIIAHIENE